MAGVTGENELTFLGSRLSEAAGQKFAIYRQHESSTGDDRKGE